MRFPIDAVKRDYPARGRRTLVQAMMIDTKAARIGARTIKRLYPAMSTKGMLRLAGIKRVAVKRILTGNEGEIIGLNQQVQKPRFSANTAIAIVHCVVFVDQDTEAHFAAMAAAFKLHLFCHRGPIRHRG